MGHSVFLSSHFPYGQKTALDVFLSLGKIEYDLLRGVREFCVVLSQKGEWAS